MTYTKFHIATSGEAPVADTSATASLDSSKVVPSAVAAMRKASSAGTPPPIAAHTNVLQRNPDLANAALQLASFHYSAIAGGLEPPTASQVSAATPELAKRLGLNDTAPKSAPSLQIGPKQKKSPSVR